MKKRPKKVWASYSYLETAHKCSDDHNFQKPQTICHAYHTELLTFAGMQFVKPYWHPTDKRWPPGLLNNFNERNIHKLQKCTNNHTKTQIKLRRSLASSSSTTSWRYSGGVRLTTLCIVRRMADGASLQNTITTLAVGRCFGYLTALQLTTQTHQLSWRHSFVINSLMPVLNSIKKPTRVNLNCTSTFMKYVHM